MKHQKKGRKFGRVAGQRRALLKSLAVALIMNGKIKTTLAKAKELRPYAERLVTYAKNPDKTIAFRRAGEKIPKAAAKKLITSVAPKYIERKGGYTRIIKAGRRQVDAAEMAYIEFI